MRVPGSPAPRLPVRRAGGHHQREQMLGCGMRREGTRRSMPVHQRILPMLRIDHRRAQPRVEILRRRVAPARHHIGQVVVAHAAADDQHVAAAQRCQRASDREVLAGIETLNERKLENRHVRLRIDEHERHEHAVVDPARAIDVADKAGIAQQRADLGGQRRRARDQITQLVGVGRKA